MTGRILVIARPDASREQVRRWLEEGVPHNGVEVREPALGCPTAGFDWQDYRLLVLSYQLGLDHEDGLAWLRRLRSDPTLPPVIMLTAHGSEETAVQALKLGARDYLPKRGLTPDRLIDAVREVLAEVPPRDADPMEQTIRLTPEEEAAPTYSVPEGASANTATPAQRFFGSGDGAAASVGSVEVPGYVVEGYIGAGGMASVYLARRLEDDLRVALKILPLNDQWDPGLLRRFVREYNLLGQLEHPNVVHNYERAFARDFAYIAMEYFEGGDLAARIADGLPHDTAVDYLRRIAAGLGAAHDLGILHRDIKPSNVLFRADGTPAIVDFGISKMRDDISTLSISPLAEASPALLGTPFYVSPEYIQDRSTDERSDLYSLGVMLYELITGTRPFRGKNLPELLQAHLHAPIPRLPEGLKRLQPVVDGLLAKDPDDRFQSAEELLVGIDWED